MTTLHFVKHTEKAFIIKEDKKNKNLMRIIFLESAAKNIHRVNYVNHVDFFVKINIYIISFFKHNFSFFPFSMVDK